jgi:hypothetical protein
MKRLFIILLQLLLFSCLTALHIVFIPTKSFEQTKTIFADENINIHYYRNEFLVATTNQTNLPENGILLKANFDWEKDKLYILYFEQNKKTDYLAKVQEFAEILYEDSYFAIIKSLHHTYDELLPQVHGGIVRIFPSISKLPEPRNFPSSSQKNRTIPELINQVAVSELSESVQHLESYQTRKWNTPQAIQAQNWIQMKFEELNLATELVNIPQGSQYSKNVIACLPGLVYPDEYVVLGAHYDSISNYGNAPGADDNASGTASILEIARILSNYHFARSILFCAFTAEEIGLYGSQAFVQQALQNGMDILGYFNIDMAGYLQAGTQPHTHIIAPASAQPLVDYYIDIVNLYLPNFPATQETFIYGDSDHTSFNNAGIMGIFPFEDVENYSPYIHSPNDIFGLSVNHLEQHVMFTQATLASVANLAEPLQNYIELNVLPHSENVVLNWNLIDYASLYAIYRNEQLYSATVEPFFQDFNVQNGNFYTYQIKAFSQNGVNELAFSPAVTVMPAVNLPFPYYNSINSNTANMVFEDTWGICQTESYTDNVSIADSPHGNYQNSLESSFILNGIDLSSTQIAYLTFFAKCELAINDTVFVEFSANPGAWIILDFFTNQQFSWQEKTYSLQDFSGKPNQLLRFRLKTDETETASGIYLDDFSVYSEFTSTDADFVKRNIHLSAYPNPFNPSTTLRFFLPDVTLFATLKIVNVKGQTVKEMYFENPASGWHNILWNGKDEYGKNVSSGLYFAFLQTPINSVSKKILLLK